MVPGARIELATPAFSGRRSTNELPRHWCLEIVGVMRSRVNSAKKQVVGQPDQELRDVTTIRTTVPSELLTWLVGKVSAFCLRMRGRDRIMHAKLSTREQRVCLVEHVAKSF